MTGRRGPGAPDTAGATVPLSRLHGPGHGTLGASLAVVLVVGLLVAKPWSGGTSASSHAPAAEAQASPPATRAPSPSPSPSTGRNAIACLDDRWWRVVTVERSAGAEQRGWYRVFPLPEATSAADHWIPFRRIVTGSPDALGFCAPDGRPAGAVRFWRLDADARVHRLDGVEALDDSGGPGQARLFRPPSLVGPYGFASWPIGLYVLSVRLLDGGPSWWIGLRLERPPAGG